MQTIQIDTDLYNQLVEAGINIQDELQKLADGFVLDVKTSYGEKPLLSKEEIAKVVENSQRIEGYEPVSKEYELEVEAFMKEHKIEVSS
ncbi:MAG: Unknown protein [uncultured Sulfurovum sp.]|uniref:Uncharacterized protein n=1 Tax=uncultured Sulfurovum sp. TaxID=269237 RepID=A0A6S6TH60_9BACT|nr:MAG: Unknown protein [uncultured Sulfurovum sp.]